MNEVYGTINLSVSMPVEAEGDRGILEAGCKVGNLKEFKNIRLEFEDSKGIVHKVNIHDYDIEWERNFGSDES